MTATEISYKTILQTNKGIANMTLRSGSLKLYRSFLGMVPVKVMDVLEKSVRVNVTESVGSFEKGKIYTFAKRDIYDRPKVARKAKA